jgi:hypothetical protein
MKILATLIKRKLKAQTGEWGHCVIYEDELQRVWPLKRKIERQRSLNLRKSTGSA